ncbi:MAG: YeeE/YedE family protein, partial [Arcobacter sp.]|nr:YeeE/YedE family protein [Arcobacter sp.]
INVFLENRSEIDIILLDINLPNSTGIELLEEIRKVDWDIPILIVAAFTEVESLLKSIKFNITNYIVKPMQLNTTLKIISQLMEVKEQKRELARKDNELKQFISILDSYNIICELDLEFNITSANDAFLSNSGYELNEVIGKNISDKSMLCSHETQGMKIQDSLLRGNTWVGLSKKVSKEGNFYYTHSTILPIYHNNGKIKKFIEFATLISKYENEILALKKHILILKSENFKAYQELKKENQSNIELVGISFVYPTAKTLELFTYYQVNEVTFGISMVVGVLTGTFIMSFFNKKYSFGCTANKNINKVKYNMIGGALMGTGGIMAIGCTVGQGLTGLSTLAFASALAIISIFISALITAKILNKYEKLPMCFIFEWNDEKENKPVDFQI